MGLGNQVNTLTPFRKLPETRAMASIEADDLDPVGAFACRVLLEQPQSATPLVDGIDRDRRRLLAGGDEEFALGIDRKSARLLFGGRASQIRELPARGVDAERGERATGALRDVENPLVRGHVNVSGPDVVVGVARWDVGPPDASPRCAWAELRIGRKSRR